VHPKGVKKVIETEQGGTVKGTRREREKYEKVNLGSGGERAHHYRHLYTEKGMRRYWKVHLWGVRGEKLSFILKNHSPITEALRKGEIALQSPLRTRETFFVCSYSLEG